MIDKSASKLLCCKSRHQRWYQYSLYPRQWTLPRRNVVSTGGVPVKEPPAIIRTDIVRLRCGIVDKPSSAPRGRSSSRNTATKTSRFWKLLQMPGPPTGSSHWSTGTHKEARCDGGYSSASLGTSPNGSIGGGRYFFTLGAPHNCDARDRRSHGSKRLMFTTTQWTILSTVKPTFASSMFTTPNGVKIVGSKGQLGTSLVSLGVFSVGGLTYTLPFTWRLDPGNLVEHYVKSKRDWND